MKSIRGKHIDQIEIIFIGRGTIIKGFGGEGGNEVSPGIPWWSTICIYSINISVRLIYINLLKIS